MRVRPERGYHIWQGAVQSGVPIPQEWKSMNYGTDKVDEMVLALLCPTATPEGRGWKGHEWDALDRLHAKG